MEMIQEERCQTPSPEKGRSPKIKATHHGEKKTVMRGKSAPALVTKVKSFFSREKPFSSMDGLSTKAGPKMKNQERLHKAARMARRQSSGKSTMFLTPSLARLSLCLLPTIRHHTSSPPLPSYEEALRMQEYLH